MNNLDKYKSARIGKIFATLLLGSLLTHCASASKRIADPIILIEKGEIKKVDTFGVHIVADDNSGKVYKTKQFPDTKDDNSFGDYRLEAPFLNCADIEYIGEQYSNFLDHEAIFIQLSNPGALKLANNTGANIGKTMAIVVQGEVILAPTIRNEVSGGKLVLSLLYRKYTNAQVYAITDNLNECWR